MVHLQKARALGAQVFPGLMLCATVAAAAMFLSEHYGGPAMLFALLIGIAFNFTLDEGRARAGVEVGSRMVLRLGVALLGLRITIGEIAAFGWGTPLMVAGLIAATVATGLVAAHAFGRGWQFGLVTGGAVAICGASAALAIAAVMPAEERTERDVLFTVVAVTTLSTVAMVVYPVLFATLGLGEREIGVLIGATIHDVAQVVGAGYSVSDDAGDVATVVKLMRVAALPLVLLGIVMALRRRGAGGRVQLLPWFMVVFVALSLLRSVVALPEALIEAAGAVSRALLVTAIAALGVKTSLKAMLALGRGHVLVVVGETLVLLVSALLALRLVPG